MGMLMFNYYTEYAMVNGQNVSINQTFSDVCGCTLIDRYTVITSANCIKKNAVFEKEGESLTVPIVFNEYYPSIESMIEVRFGMNKERDPYAPIKRYYVQKIPVDKVIIVSI